MRWIRRHSENSELSSIEAHYYDVSHTSYPKCTHFRTEITRYEIPTVGCVRLGKTEVLLVVAGTCAIVTIPCWAKSTRPVGQPSILQNLKSGRIP